MRKEITFKIEGYDKKFIVKELIVREILNIFDVKKDVSLLSLLDEKFLPISTNLTLDEIQDMALSDLSLIWTKFKEINSIFFVLAQKMGTDRILQKIKNTIMDDFLASYANLQKQDT